MTPKLSYSQILEQGLQELGITLSTSAQQQLVTYVELLAKWSKVYNLTTVREPAEIITHHILDSLAVVPYLKNVTTVLDVGTGAGLPGIPLAIARPDISFKLLDSQQKKINFVQHVITSMQLANVSALWSRVESLSGDYMPDMVISRAFASLSDFVTLIANVCDSSTQIVAMKGRKEQVDSEQEQLPGMFKVTRIQELYVPGLSAERCLVFLTKQGD
jgi:16S rRNA (guanine527-N7)-methyltransferase